MGGSIAKIPPPLFIYGDGFFRGPLGFEVGFRSTPFRKWVLSYRSKKTNNPNPSPIGKRFGLYGSAISGQNRFFRPHSPIPQGGGVRGDSLRVPPAGFQSTSPQAGHFQTIDCYGGKNIILKNKSQILKKASRHFLDNF